VCGRVPSAGQVSLSVSGGWGDTECYTTVNIVPLTQAKLKEEKPYECPLLGLTPADVAVLQKVVSDQVKLHFNPEWPFSRQQAWVKTKSPLALERMVSSLAHAEQNWAALCRLSNSNHSFQANDHRRRRRQELRKRAEDKRLADLQTAEDKNQEEDAQDEDTGELDVWLRHECGRD